MSEQSKKESWSPGPPASRGHTIDQKLPVEIPKNREYNVNTGKNEMDPKQRGDITCDVVNQSSIEEIFSELNLIHRQQLISLIDFLALSSGGPQIEQFLNQLEKEI